MMRSLYVPLGLGLVASVATAAFAEDEYEQLEYDEFVPIIEINATDGDIGFHVLLDGEAWQVSRIFDSDWDRMLRVRGTDDLEEQGVTELFIESAEPLCWEDPERDPDDPIFTLEEFLDRFKAGTYHARGRTLEGELLRAEAELTHELPAAPSDVEVNVDMDDGEVEVEISWSKGDDLGNCAYPDGLIPDPAEVDVYRWEIVVEPNEDQVPEGMAISKFVVQLPGSLDADDLEVEVSEAFIGAYLDAGVTEFKYEIGAREESGNQTFTEGEFEIELD